MWFLIVLALVLFSAPIKAQDVWWKNAVIYQIYPLSFRDSDNDGYGDLKGVTEKLMYVKSMGADAIWMAPIYESPLVDGGYDISNFTAVNSILGTMSDFEDLMAEAKRLQLKVILDFVPNHTSDQHEWFQKAARGESHSDYFTVKNCYESFDEYPNNWMSSYGGRAWASFQASDLCYLHKFARNEADLNYRNPKVSEYMESVLRFWLDRDVDGFRIHAPNHLVENSDLLDEPLKNQLNPTRNYDSYMHIHTENLPESYAIVFSWRAILDEYMRKDGYERLLITDCYGTLENITAYYGNDSHLGASFSINYHFATNIRSNSTAKEIKSIIDDWLKALGPSRASNWILGNHDTWRAATKFGKGKIDGLNMLIMTLPGVVMTYNGEEIGMENGNVSWEQTKDIRGLQAGPEHYEEMTRDFERTPFQWDESQNAGFNIGGTPWLPVSKLYKTNNVAAQTRAHESHLKVYEALIALRKKSRPLIQGNLKTFTIGDDILVITRNYNSEDVVTVLNLSEKELYLNLGEFISRTELVVEVASVGSETVKGTKISGPLTLQGHEALVLVS